MVYIYLHQIGEQITMIKFDEGRPTLCGRVTWGYKVGFITEIKRHTYRVRWLDGAETEQLRPDDEEEAA